MADAVSTRTLVNSPTRVVIEVINRSDGVGESDVVKLDKSTFTTIKGTEPGQMSLASVQWSIQGFSSVQLEWDHTTDDVIAHLAAGNGAFDYEAFGTLRDPLSSGGTGDILLTTFGAVNNATYTIILEFVKGN